MQNNEVVKQINSYAMRDGITLGVFGIVSLVAFKWSFSLPGLSTLFSIMLLGTPVFATYLTLRFRNDVTEMGEDFAFLRGFLHALFTGFYASILVAVVVFVYLQYFDHDAIFAAYGRSIDTPEMQQYLLQSGMDAQLSELSGGHGVQGLVNALQSLGASTYSALSIYCSMIFGPVIAAIIGLVARRG